MPDGNDYQHIPTLVELAQDAERNIKSLEKEYQELTEEIEKLKKENTKLRELLMTKVMDFKKIE